jgi:MerR family mercuric resistance operon transcriptional regulator
VSNKISEKDFLLIGELADLSEVSRDTLRHYERKGVLPLPVRSANGYRLYSAQSVERVRLIRRCLAVGFTLDELARIFAERKRGNVPCREVYSLVAGKLENVKRQIVEMEVLRDELENLVTEWDKKLEEVSENAPAHLLEDLAVSLKFDGSNRKKTTAGNFRRQNKKGSK